ncbi:TPA: site-specific integrase [Streptococcus suis]|nr:site-specific integrase [Streptococcus suis]
MWIEAHKSGKVNFVERYRDPYTQKWKRTSVLMEKDTPRIRKEAQKILDAKIANILRELSTSDALFTDVLDSWWKFHKKEIRRSSISSMTSNVQFVKENFGIGVQIARIDTFYVQNFINDLDLSRPRLERIKSILNLCFDYAVTLGYIEHNPARRAKLPEKILTIEDYEKIKNKYLEIETELIPLINELKRNKRTYRNGLLAEFLFVDGARIGEAVALEISNYRKSDGYVDLFGTLDSVLGYKKAKKEPPKTPAGYRSNRLSKREIEILDEAIELRELNKNTNPNWIEMDREYIFVTDKGVPLQRNAFNKSIQAANQRLPKPINKPITSHIFRHTLVSFLAEKGVPLKAIMDRVGHEDSDTTMKIYTHVTNKMKEKVIEVIDELPL